MPASIVELPWLRSPPGDFADRCRAAPSAADTTGKTLHFLADFRLTSREASQLARAIHRSRVAGKNLAPLTPFRLGVLAGATYELMLDDLVAAAARHGVMLEIVTAPYDQVMQQALDPASQMNAARVDAVLLAVDHRWLKLDRAALSGDPMKTVADAVEQLKTVVEALRTYGGAPSIVQTLPSPPSSSFGSFDRHVSGTIRAMIDEANRAIATVARETGAYTLDVAALAERAGTDRWFDPVQWAAYKMPFSADCVPVYADFLGRLLGALRGKARKCLVLDLDNTIWGGVIGDDGVGGIQVGQGSAAGEAFLSVQQSALALRDRGVVLAVCSKNDDAVARTPFREHPEMLLKEEHFAVFQANWTDKASNLEAIAKALNIGLDAIVFVDDNPAERAQVRAALPEVAVPELPQDPSYYAWYLDAAGYFEAVAFSEEDRLRVASYAADAQRAEVMAKAHDTGDYLTSLEMVVRFAPFDELGRQRIAQLINKTNQFNLTTRRYTASDVTAMESDASLFTLQVRLADRFGDLGMIGVIIARPMAGRVDTWDIDTWLMSCRALGRQIEQAMLAKVAGAAAARGVRRLVGTYIPTPKNGMVADHYQKLGFVPAARGDGGQTMWELDVTQFATPELPMRIEDLFVEPATPSR